MSEIQDETRGQIHFSTIDQQQELRLQKSFQTAITTSFEWDIESDTFVRLFSNEPMLPANRELPESLIHLFWTTGGTFAVSRDGVAILRAAFDSMNS